MKTFNGSLKRFELFYSSGGHGGPYYDLEEAIREATRRIGPEEQVINICPYDAHSSNGYGLSVYRVTWKTTGVAPKQESRASISERFPDGVRS